MYFLTISNPNIKESDYAKGDLSFNQIMQYLNNGCWLENINYIKQGDEAFSLNLKEISIPL